jgi:hypothetical protein
VVNWVQPEARGVFCSLEGADGLASSATAGDEVLVMRLKMMTTRTLLNKKIKCLSKVWAVEGGAQYGELSGVGFVVRTRLL